MSATVTRGSPSRERSPPSRGGCARVAYRPLASCPIARQISTHCHVRPANLALQDGCDGARAKARAHSHTCSRRAVKRTVVEEPHREKPERGADQDCRGEVDRKLPRLGARHRTLDSRYESSALGKGPPAQPRGPLASEAALYRGGSWPPRPETSSIASPVGVTLDGALIALTRRRHVGDMRLKNSPRRLRSTDRKLHG